MSMLKLSMPSRLRNRRLSLSKQILNSFMADATLTPTEEQQATTAAKQATTTSATEAIWTVGRRKSAVARVKMTQGSGDITVNDRPLEEYATAALAKARALAPLAVSDRLDSFDISIKVAGGGKLTQLDAIS